MGSKEEPHYLQMAERQGPGSQGLPSREGSRSRTQAKGMELPRCGPCSPSTLAVSAAELLLLGSPRHPRLKRGGDLACSFLGVATLEAMLGLTVGPGQLELSSCQALRDHRGRRGAELSASWS